MSHLVLTGTGPFRLSLVCIAVGVDKTACFQTGT